jgi:hypothetical protein
MVDDGIDVGRLHPEDLFARADLPENELARLLQPPYSDRSALT